jgi:UDP-N-acetylglucosamine acyltransferase
LIHPSAVVDPTVQLEGVRVGPFAVIEGPCILEPGVEIGPHAVIHPWVHLAQGVKVGPHSVLGGAPQDLSYKGQETWLKVGARTLIREAVTLHRATLEDPTVVGEDCYLMGHVHIGHDCKVGNGVIITQSTSLAGHVEVGNYAVLGGSAGIHQFVRIGSLAMVGAMSKVTRDVLPFSLVDGTPALHYRLNSVGLRRSGITGEAYTQLEAAFKALQKGSSFEPQSVETQVLQAFLDAPSKRGFSGFVER